MNDITLPKLAVLDSEMAYREAGGREKPVALFLHGNPTSSYIWRNIIPLAAEVAHCVAPDFIGFGQSGKLEIAYRFEDHARYLDAFIAKAGIGSRRIGALRSPSISRRGGRTSSAASRSWSSSGRSRPGMSSSAARRRAGCFASSAPPARAKN
jgi:alpha/beta hydrolase fold